MIAYHLDDSLAPGGFIGVDVFLVISGFLMTQIIVGRLQAAQFRLWGFYAERLRRIWPALAALCLCLCIAGATLLDPWTFEQIAADIPAVLLFVSNIAFASRGGYFAPDETPNWLQHTWSLSLEWQFYLLYPLVLAAVWALPALRRWLWPIVGVLTAASFGLAVRGSLVGALDAYYALPTRGWELLAGALCAAASGVQFGPAIRWTLHLAGIALIGAGAIVAVPAEGWPSPLALLPVGGAALVLVAGVGRTIWAENPVVATVGRASYSIYLWHWPVVIALRQADAPMTAATGLGAVAIMLALGFASYWLVERAATSWVFAPGRRRWAFGLGAVIAIGAFGFVCGRSRGLEALRTAAVSPAERAQMADFRAASADWAFPQACGRVVRSAGVSHCQIGDAAARQVLVIGDSQAEQVAPRYRHAFDGKPGEGITFVAVGGCLPIPGVDIRYRHGCAAWARHAFHDAETSGFRRVAIISAWPLYFGPRAGASRPGACLAASGCSAAQGGPAGLVDASFDLLAAEIVRLRRRGVDVVLFASMPAGVEADPRRLYRRLLRMHELEAPPLPRSGVEQAAGLERAALKRIAGQTGARLVDPLDGLCPS
ncbi:MAG TPA: acyltransferase family protein, partial [Caulobacteraceae bacterium]|nr:acyltransferase family protein [Caulobacteraceae bacterium]